MIEQNRPFDDFNVTCDDCGEEENFDTDGNFKMLLADLKSHGWMITKENDQWRHYCPNCTHDEA